MAQVQNNEMYKKNFNDMITKTIMNNEKHSDVTFVVNGKNYHACKIVMSVASEVFAFLITEHFENCMDKEVLVTGVKYNESFLNMLRYIHGVEINLTTMSKLVLIEMLTLTKEYKLDEFHVDLKDYINKLKQFKLSSIVAMLNAAKTYDLVNLYKNLKKYVYTHTEQFIKHKSFHNLKYEVLLDLLGSDYFYSDEIDILWATLNWHDKNIIEVEEKEKIDREIDEGIHFEDNLNIFKYEVDDSAFQKHVVEQFLGKFSDELFDNGNDKERNVDVQNEEGSAKSEILTDVQDENIHLVQPNSNVKNISEAASNSSATNIIQVNESESTVVADTNNMNDEKKNTQVEIFSENVLKTLLKHIRFARISMLNFVKTSGVFNKYKARILNLLNELNTSDVPRYDYCSKYIELRFTIKGISEDIENLTCESVESHRYESFTFSVFACGCIDELSKKKSLVFILSGSTEQEKPKLTLRVQLTLLSYSPLISSDVSMTFDENFTQENSIWKLVSFPELLDPKRNFIQNGKILIKVILTILNNNLE